MKALLINMLPGGVFSKYFDFGVKLCLLSFNLIGCWLILEATSKTPKMSRHNDTRLISLLSKVRSLIINVATTQPPYAVTFIWIMWKCLQYACVSEWEVCVSVSMWAFTGKRQWLAACQPLAVTMTEQNALKSQLSSWCQCLLRVSIPQAACRGPYCTMTEVWGGGSVPCSWLSLRVSDF